MHNAALAEASVETPHVDKWVKGVCRYCGAGCGVYAGVVHETERLSPTPFRGKVVAVKGDEDNWNKGALCVKGHHLPAILYAEDRLKYPMLRRGGRFIRVSWKDAMDLMVERFSHAIKEHGADAVAFYGSGQMCIEESYFMAKFFKGGLGANNIDANSRLCMASAATGYVGAYGKDEPMGSYEDIYHADCFFIIGSNMAETHPVIFKLIEERKKKDRG